MAILDEVRPAFAAADAELDVKATDCPGHATDLVRTLDLSPCDGLVRDRWRRDDSRSRQRSGCSAAQPAATPLGLIPGGTGNSVALHLGYTTPLEAARRILAGHTQAWTSPA